MQKTAKALTLPDIEAWISGVSRDYQSAYTIWRKMA